MGLSELLSAYGPNYLTALLTTWRITFISFALVMVLSVLITVLRVCPFKPLRLFGDFYVQVFRNIPGAVLLLIVVYALPHLKLILDYEPSVVLCTVLLGSAFGSENFMSGINTIGVGQIEAARHRPLIHEDSSPCCDSSGAPFDGPSYDKSLYCCHAHHRPWFPGANVSAGAHGPRLLYQHP